MSVIPDPATTDWVPLWSVSQQAPPVPGMVVLYDETLAAARASIDIQNIPQTYAHLRLVMRLRTNHTAAYDWFFIRFNNDTGANYGRHYISSQGAVAPTSNQSAGETALIGLDGSAGGASAGLFSSGEIQIPDYASTSKNKQMPWTNVFHDGTNYVSRFGQCHWNQLQGVNRITLTPANGTLIVAGSRVTLYALDYASPLPPAAFYPPTYGTTLPVNPADGQEHVLVDSLTNPSYSWRLRFNAGSSSAYKWEFVGGSPLEGVNVAGQSGITSGTFVQLAGPTLTLPRSGDYNWAFDGWIANNTAGATTLVAVSVGAPANDDNSAVFIPPIATNNGTVHRAGRILAVAGGASLASWMRVTSGQGSYLRLHSSVVPVRLA